MAIGLLFNTEGSSTCSPVKGFTSSGKFSGPNQPAGKTGIVAVGSGRSVGVGSKVGIEVAVGGRGVGLSRMSSSPSSVVGEAISLIAAGSVGCGSVVDVDVDPMGVEIDSAEVEQPETMKAAKIISEKIVTILEYFIFFYSV